MNSIGAMIEESPQMKALHDFLTASPCDSNQKWEEYLALVKMDELVSSSSTTRSPASMSAPSSAVLTSSLADSYASSAPVSSAQHTSSPPRVPRRATAAAASVSTTRPAASLCAPRSTFHTISSAAASPHPTTLAARYTDLGLKCNTTEDDLTLPAPTTCSTDCRRGYTGMVLATPTTVLSTTDPGVCEVHEGADGLTTTAIFPSFTNEFHEPGASFSQAETSSPTPAVATSAISEELALDRAWDDIYPPLAELCQAAMTDAEWAAMTDWEKDLWEMKHLPEKERLNSIEGIVMWLPMEQRDQRRSELLDEVLRFGEPTTASIQTSVMAELYASLAPASTVLGGEDHLLETTATCSTLGLYPDAPTASTVLDNDSATTTPFTAFDINHDGSTAISRVTMMLGDMSSVALTTEITTTLLLQPLPVHALSMLAPECLTECADGQKDSTQYASEFFPWAIAWLPCDFRPCSSSVDDQFRSGLVVPELRHGNLVQLMSSFAANRFVPAYKYTAVICIQATVKLPGLLMALQKSQSWQCEFLGIPIQMPAVAPTFTPQLQGQVWVSPSVDQAMRLSSSILRVLSSLILNLAGGKNTTLPKDITSVQFATAVWDEGVWPSPFSLNVLAFNLQVYVQKNKSRILDMSGCLLFARSNNSRGHEHFPSVGEAIDQAMILCSTGLHAWFYWILHLVGDETIILQYIGTWHEKQYHGLARQYYISKMIMTLDATQYAGGMNQMVLNNYGSWSNYVQPVPSNLDSKVHQYFDAFPGHIYFWLMRWRITEDGPIMEHFPGCLHDKIWFSIMLNCELKQLMMSMFVIRRCTTLNPSSGSLQMLVVSPLGLDEGKSSAKLLNASVVILQTNEKFSNPLLGHLFQFCQTGYVFPSSSEKFLWEIAWLFDMASSDVGNLDRSTVIWYLVIEIGCDTINANIHRALLAMNGFGGDANCFFLGSSCSCSVLLIFEQFEWQIAWPSSAVGSVVSRVELVLRSICMDVTCSFKCTFKTESLVCDGQPSALCLTVIPGVIILQDLQLTWDPGKKILDWVQSAVQVPWDPGGSTWSRLEGKPNFMKGGLSATFPVPG